MNVVLAWEHHMDYRILGCISFYRSTLSIGSLNSGSRSWYSWITAARCFSRHLRKRRLTSWWCSSSEAGSGNIISSGTDHRPTAVLPEHERSEYAVYTGQFKPAKAHAHHGVKLGSWSWSCTGVVICDGEAIESGFTKCLETKSSSMCSCENGPIQEISA